MDLPLTKWYCDVCDQKIENIDDGYVIWKNKADSAFPDYKIIHRGDCDLNGYTASAALNNFIGDDGLASLLSKLSGGPIRGSLGSRATNNNDEYVDLVRRVQTPFYEEARRNFKKATLLSDLCEYDEVSLYCPSSLKKIIEKY